MTQLTHQAQSQAVAHTAETVASDLERLTHLLPSLRECPKAKAEARQMLAPLTTPAHPVWLMARVAALLSPYFEKDTPQAVREIEAEDWAHELRDKPQWAVEKAVRWWKSADNPRRRIRPLEGDISGRVRFEMMAVRAAQIHINASGQVPAPQERVAPLTDEDRAERSQTLQEVMAHLTEKAKENK
jgi:hypothetical protein